jgi:hypothetical protein
MLDHVMAHEVERREELDNRFQYNDAVADMHVLAGFKARLQRTIKKGVPVIH